MAALTGIDESVAISCLHNWEDSTDPQIGLNFFYFVVDWYSYPFYLMAKLAGI